MLKSLKFLLYRLTGRNIKITQVQNGTAETFSTSPFSEFRKKKEMYCNRPESEKLSFHNISTF